MPTWWPSSKKCSTHDLLRIAATVALLLTPSARASVPHATPAQPLAAALGKDIASRQGLSFGEILKSWETRYGTRAVSPLLQLASNRKSQDADRYLALMGAAKLGGPSVAPQVTPFLRDPSWMIRSGALRALSALKNPATTSGVLGLLHDPSLIVRTEAVEAAALLQPAGTVDALLATLEDSANYHQGKAQWVPARVLGALVRLRATQAAAQLRPLLFHTRDPELQKQTVQALEQLTGRKIQSSAPLQARIEAWKQALAKTSASTG